MNYASILQCDIANGDGFRVSLFVSGCARKCPGCFNGKAQDPAYGKPFDQAAKDAIFAELSQEYCAGLSLLGGDPMSKLGDNRIEVIKFCREVKARFPTKDIIMWTGYTLEEIKNSKEMSPILETVDIIIDGPFVQELHDPALKWRGSSNQRILRKGMDF